MDNPDKITVGSLFSGLGGLELGLEWTGGFETIWQVEIDDYATKVLEKHWPDVKRYRDVKEVGKHNLEPVDVICGGFPCQDISVAGKRVGIKEGERSGLWFEFKRIIRELRPRYALIENVPGILVFPNLHTVLCDLAKIGYDAEWQTISARQFGARHLRRRIFVVAYAESMGRREGSIEPKGSGEWRTHDKSCNRSKTLADSVSKWQSQPQGSVENERRRISDPSSNVPDSDFPRSQRRVFGGKCTRELLARTRSEAVKGAWKSDAGIRRVAHGIPNRIHRLKCLGNAVVPYQSQLVGECILEHWMTNR